MADFAPAAFRRGPFTVEADGLTYTFPALSAAEWLDTLAYTSWPAAVLHRVPDAQYEAFLAIPDLDKSHLLRMAHAVLEGAGGRPWWQVERVAHAVLGAPNLLGGVLLRGVDPERMTLAAFVSAVWVLLTQSGDDMQRAQMEMELTAPPPEALEEQGPQEMSMDDMVAMMRGVPGMSTR